AEEAEYRPRADGQEEGAGCQPDKKEHTHQHGKAAPAERAVRCEQCAEEGFVCGGCGHAHDYRVEMTKPKEKNAAARRAAASTGSPARSRRRGRTAYSPAEIEEMFRRFSVQRPEPKGELEHVNA